MTALDERLAVLRAAFGLSGDAYISDPQVVALEAAVMATAGDCADVEACASRAVEHLSDRATPAERGMARAFALCLASADRDASDLDGGGASLPFSRRKTGPKVEDLTLDALERIADSLGAHRPKPDLTFKRGQARFKIVCLEVFSQLTESEPRLNAAFLLVMGVEAGYIARRDLEKAAERLADLSAMDRAFAVGMAAGFMTEFLPRPV